MLFAEKTQVRTTRADSVAAHDTLSRALGAHAPWGAKQTRSRPRGLPTGRRHEAPWVGAHTCLPLTHTRDTQAKGLQKLRWYCQASACSLCRVSLPRAPCRVVLNSCLPLLCPLRPVHTRSCARSSAATRTGSSAMPPARATCVRRARVCCPLRLLCARHSPLLLRALFTCRWPSSGSTPTKWSATTARSLSAASWSTAPGRTFPLPAVGVHPNSAHLTLASRFCRHRNTRVTAQVVYNEYIADKEHIHMNGAPRLLVSSTLSPLL